MKEMNTSDVTIENIYPSISYAVHRKTEAGWKINSRTIPDHELVLIEKGSGFVEIEGEKHMVGPATLFYFFPGLTHSLRTEDTDPFSFLAVHFSYVFPEKRGENWIFGPTIPKLPLKPVQKIHNPRVLSESMARLVNYQNSFLPGRDLTVRALFQICIYQILINSTDNLNFSAKARIDMIANHINENIERPFTARELASIARVTPDYLSRLFKHYTGYTLMDYVHYCKIERAKAYLFEGNLKVREIAQKLSFSDEFHFSKVFKKVEGICPSQFKQNIYYSSRTEECGISGERSVPCSEKIDINIKTV